MQSRTGVTQFVAPGPEVTITTPTPPACARIAGGHEAGTLLVGRDNEAHGLDVAFGVLLVVPGRRRRRWAE